MPSAPSVPTPARLLIADDHPAVRAGLCRLLGACDDIEVVAVASDGAAAARLARELRPDVVLMDLRMPGVDGIEATREITAARLQTRVVVITSAGAGPLRRAHAAGAVGHVLKHAPEEEIVRAVREAARMCGDGGDTVRM